MTAREELQTQGLGFAAREELAAVLAMTGDYDGCFERVAEWEALEQWERDADPENEPHSDREDCEWWLKRADALLASLALARLIRERQAEALSAFADTRGVNVDDQESEWMRGYRQAQRECFHDAVRQALAIRADQTATEEPT